jgi:high-affinity Fe2+/Pb2+ permease
MGVLKVDLGLAVVLAVLAWWTVGVAGYVFWWTREHDLQSDDLAVGLFIGLALGPLAWLVGWHVHGSHNRRTLMRRRS